MIFSKELELRIKNQVFPSKKLCEFQIIGLYSRKIDIYTSALLVLEHISEWVNKDNLQIFIKRDRFKEIFIQEIKKVKLDSPTYSTVLFEMRIRNRVRKSGYLLIEIPPSHAKILRDYIRNL